MDRASKASARNSPGELPRDWIQAELPHRPALRLQQAQNMLDERGLTRPVGANQNVNSAPCHRQKAGWILTLLQAEAIEYYRNTSILHCSVAGNAESSSS